MQFAVSRITLHLFFPCPLAVRLRLGPNGGVGTGSAIVRAVSIAAIFFVPGTRFAWDRPDRTAASRSARLHLYFRAQWWRFQSPSSLHRSMKCSCAAERSLSAEACHLLMNSCGVMGAFSVAHHCHRRHGSCYTRCPRGVLSRTLCGLPRGERGGQNATEPMTLKSKSGDATPVSSRLPRCPSTRRSCRRSLPDAAAGTRGPPSPPPRTAPADRTHTPLAHRSPRTWEARPPPRAAPCPAGPGDRGPRWRGAGSLKIELPPGPLPVTSCPRLHGCDAFPSAGLQDCGGTVRREAGS